MIIWSFILTVAFFTDVFGPTIRGDQVDPKIVISRADFQLFHRQKKLTKKWLACS